MTFLKYISKLLERNGKLRSYRLFTEKESFIFVKAIKFLSTHQRAIYSILMYLKEDAVQDMRFSLDKRCVFDNKLP